MSEVKAFDEDPYALPNRRREFWEFLAEGDLLLVKSYGEDVCASLGMGFDKVMGLRLPGSKGLRLLCIDAIFGYFKSGAIGNDSLTGDYSGHIVGVAPKSLELRVA